MSLDLSATHMKFLMFVCNELFVCVHFAVHMAAAQSSGCNCGIIQLNFIGMSLCVAPQRNARKGLKYPKGRGIGTTAPLLTNFHVSDRSLTQC